MLVFLDQMCPFWLCLQIMEFSNLEPITYVVDDDCEGKIMNFHYDSCWCLLHLLTKMKKIVFRYSSTKFKVFSTMERIEYQSRWHDLNSHFEVFSSVHSLSHVWPFATPWVAPRQASLSITISRSSPQTHVHQVGDAIQPSHPLSSPSPPAPNPSQHHSLFQWVNSSHEVAKVLEFQL